MSHPINILVAGPESDAHVVAGKLLELALEERGYAVTNLGVCCPVGVIAEAAAAAAAEGWPVVVLLCCQNGHALKDLADLPDRLGTLGVADRVRVYAGGRLAVGAEADAAAVRRRCRALGIHPLGDFEECFRELARLQQDPVKAALAA
jgi:methylmalonyl-CoA mutase cobalamin-binding subunit